MKLFKLIKDESEYIDALSRSILLLHAEPGTPESDEREFLAVLMKDYEHRLLVDAQEQFKKH